MDAMQNLMLFHNVSGDASFRLWFSRTLKQACSGQQISWLAARAIQHKFLRLYFPELPEKPDDKRSVHSFLLLWVAGRLGNTDAFLSWDKTLQYKFPTAYQVATMDLATLRTAGLSGRKAEYGARTCSASHVFCHWFIGRRFSVRDLATRFADGRLSNQKLLVANDNELFELLTAVYGIGKVSPSTYFTLSADWKIVFSSSGLVRLPSFFLPGSDVEPT
jgi:DNA-3-methyladenine glycosylase II